MAIELMGGLPSAEHTVLPLLNLGQAKSTDSFSVTTDSQSGRSDCKNCQVESGGSDFYGKLQKKSNFIAESKSEELKKAALKAQQEAQELT
jgi:hypothetical protein